LHLLRLRGDRREVESDGENDREPDHPHGHLGWRMAGGSLVHG
jgi:hypothetical protein